MIGYLTNPFRGPEPLTKDNQIFGRDEDIRLLRAQLLSDRMVLLHSASGCGKTSLVEAGLRKALRDDLTPEETISLKSNPGKQTTVDTLLAKLPRRDPRVAGPTRRRANEAGSAEIEPVEEPLQRFFFFDQFEEILTDTSLAEEDRLTFFKALGLALEPPTVWALFAIREDYLGNLQPYLRYLPNQLASRYRLTRMTLFQAAAALEMPTEQPMEDGSTQNCAAFTPAAAASLACDLAETHESGVLHQMIEPVHLQVVGLYLWEKYSKGPDGQLLGRPISNLPNEVETKGQLASVTAALGDYYAKAVAAAAVEDATGKPNIDAEYRLRKWIGTRLIDRRGPQRVRARCPKAAGQSPDVVPQEVSWAELDKLKQRYLIRDDEHSLADIDRVVELVHDRLMDPILISNAVWLGPFQQLWQKNVDDYISKPQKSLLLHGQELRLALVWAEKNAAMLNAAEVRYLNASRDEEAQQRRFRNMKIVAWASACIAIVAIVGALVRGYLAYNEIKTATQEKQQAEVVKQQAEVDKRDALVAQMESRVTLAESKTRLLELSTKYDILQTSLITKQKEFDRIAATEKANTEQAVKDSGTAIQAQIAAEKATDAAKTAMETTRKEAAADLSASSEAYGQAGLALQNIGDALEGHNLGQALTALDEVRQAGQQGVDRRDGRPSVLTRVLDGTLSLLPRLPLERTLCLGGYAQSMGVIGSTGKLIALDDTGRYYSGELSTKCETTSDLRRAFPGQHPTASAIARDAEVIALGSYDGAVTRLTQGKDDKVAGMKLRQKVIGLTLSDGGDFVGGANALWSVGVWHVVNGKGKQLVRWPGNGWNPLGWGRWLKIYASHSDKRTNAIALYATEAAQKAGTAYMIEGREDGCTAFNSVHDSRWQASNSKPLGNNCHPQSPVISVALNQDGKLLATGTRDGILRVWNLSSPQVTWTRPDLQATSSVFLTKDDNDDLARGGCNSAVTSVAFMKTDRNLLAAGCQDGTIHVYDLTGLFQQNQGSDQTSRELYFLPGRLGSVSLLSFDSANLRLYSSGNSRLIEEWNVRTQQNDLQKQSERDLGLLKQESLGSPKPEQTARAINKIILDLCGALASGEKPLVCGPQASR